MNIDNRENSQISHKASDQINKAQKDKKLAWRDIKGFGIKLIVTLLMIWILLFYVFGVTVMQGEDMYPRIRDGDLMIYYRLQRSYFIGDVVTFSNKDRRYTGRIVAKAGDIVDISENGQLLVNGNVQEEEIFYKTGKIAGKVDFPCIVPKGEVFLLCDFRTNSIDSRSYGAVSIESLDGKVITILRRRGI